MSFPKVEQEDMFLDSQLLCIRDDDIHDCFKNHICIIEHVFGGSDSVTVGCKDLPDIKVVLNLDELNGQGRNIGICFTPYSKLSKEQQFMFQLHRDVDQL